MLRAEAAFGYELRFLREIGLVPGESMAGKVFEYGRACLFATPAEVTAAMADMRPTIRAGKSRALGSTASPRVAVVAPLRVGDRKFGVLILETMQRPTEFSPGDLPFVQTLVDLIALAIDRAHLEAEADAIRDAQEAGRLRSELMATLSHELRTPLVAIKGYSSALLLDEVSRSPDKRHEFLRLIEEGCDNLQVMLSDMLDSALIDVGHFTIEPQPVRLQHLAAEVANELQPLTNLHRLVVDFSPGFLLVDVDPYRICQVIRNILDNAIKYSPSGGLIVIRGEARTKSGSRACRCQKVCRSGHFRVCLGGSRPSGNSGSWATLSSSAMRFSPPMREWTLTLPFYEPEVNPTDGVTSQ